MNTSNLIFHAWVRLNDVGKAAQFSVASITDNLSFVDLNYFVRNEIPDVCFIFLNFLLKVLIKDFWNRFCG